MLYDLQELSRTIQHDLTLNNLAPFAIRKLVCPSLMYNFTVQVIFLLSMQITQLLAYCLLTYRLWHQISERDDSFMKFVCILLFKTFPHPYARKQLHLLSFQNTVVPRNISTCLSYDRSFPFDLNTNYVGKSISYERLH